MIKFNYILKSGLIVSEFPPGIKPIPGYFPRRNRLISGLCQGVIVVEAAYKSGSLITSDFALEQGREVFAVPGRPHDKFSKGCNMLIKQQKAQMITSAADLIYFLNWDVNTEKDNKQTQLFVDLTAEEQLVVETLREIGKAELDTLSLKCRLPSHKLASILISLELSGCVRPLPGKQFEII